MSQLTLQDLRARGLLDELARVFNHPSEAAALLDSIGFPRSRQPILQAFPNPFAFWLEVCREVEAGMTPGGLEALLAAAAALFPYGPFQPWRDAKASAGGSGAAAPAATTPPSPASTGGSASPRLKVFLCHASVDKPRVLAYYDRLVALQVDPWLDKKSLVAAEEWEPAIRKAIRASHMVIVFLSPASVTGPGVRHKEVKLALDVYDEQPEGTLFLLPAALEPCEMPDRLKKFHRIDLFESDGWDNLVRSLRARAAALGLQMG